MCVCVCLLVFSVQLCLVFHWCISEKGWQRTVEVENLEASSRAARDTLCHFLQLPVLLVLPRPSNNPSRWPHTHTYTNIRTTIGHYPGVYQPLRLMLMCLLGIYAANVPLTESTLKAPGLLSVSKRGRMCAFWCLCVLSNGSNHP